MQRPAAPVVPGGTVFRSQYEDVPAVEEPIHDAVLGRAAERGDTPALIDGVDGTTLTYAQLDRVPPPAGRRVRRRRASARATYWPCTARTPSPSRRRSTPPRARGRRSRPCTRSPRPRSSPSSCATAPPSWIVTVSPLLETARQAAELAGGVREIFVCDQAPGHRSLIDLLGSTAPEPQIDIDPVEDVAALPYSSGHHRHPQGRDAHPPVHRHQPRAARRRSCRWAPATASSPCCPSSTSTGSPPS